MKKLLFLVLLTGCHKPAGLPFYQTADRTPEWITPGAPEFARIHRVADFSLVDQDGAGQGWCEVSPVGLRGAPCGGDDGASRQIQTTPTPRTTPSRGKKAKAAR